MLFRKSLLTLITLFMAVSGMPVYAEEAPAPEVTERKNDAAASTETENVLGITKLYAEEPETLTNGYLFNQTIKTLARGDYTSPYDSDSLIEAIQVVDTRPSEDITTKDVSANNDGSYLVWWDAGTKTIYLYSKSGDIVLNPDSNIMFKNCSNLTTLDASGWDTSRVTGMYNMFSGCSSLTTLDVSNWDTSKVITMNYVFDGCSSLTTLDLSSWDTSGAKTMGGMFHFCSSLTTLNVSGWDTSQVTDMNDMFGDCTSFQSLDISGWNTSQVTNMGSMFFSCRSLTTLDVSNWDTSSATNMSFMFSNCGSLTTLDVSNWDTSSATNMSNMFYNCSNLTTLDVSGFDTSQVISMSSMFSDCSNLTTLNVSGWNTNNVTEMDHMFYKCSKLTHIYIDDGWNTDKVTDSAAMFYYSPKLPHYNDSIVDKTNANADPDTGYMTYKVADLKYLKDASFVLSGTSDYGNSVNMVVSSDKNGRMSFKNLEKGTYTLTEISPTDGYIKNSGKYTVTVTDSGVSVVSDNPDFYYETEDQKVLFNEPYHSFTIQKTSSVDSTVGVEGAEFLLSGVSDYGTEVSQPQTTGKTGVATFDHLEAGSYLLTETKAPEHYALDPVSRIVTISKYGVVKIDGLSKEGSSFVWADIRNADGTITITKNWKDKLTGANASGRTLPSIVISAQRPIPDAVTVTYYAGDGYFGTDQTNKNVVTYLTAADQNGNILSVNESKGKMMEPSILGKVFDAWYLDSPLTNKAPDAIADYIKANPNEKELALYAKYKDPPMLVTGQNFNIAIKSLAAGTNKYYYDTDSLIKSVQVVDTPPSEGITTKDVSASNDGSYLVWWDADTKTIYLYSKYGDIVLNPDSSRMFYRCSSLATLDASNWDTSKVTDMSYMFDDCEGLTKLNISNWNTSKVTTMYSMFEQCGNLTALDVSKWDTSQVTNMSGMFHYCRKLPTLDVSNWDTGGVTNTSYMFDGCRSLTTIDVSKWNTSQVKNMSYMFDGCWHLTTLDVSKWNTGSVTTMYNMFDWCTSLTTLDLSRWNTSQVTNTSSMFYLCSSLTTLDVSNWDMSKVTDMSSMFNSCGKLTTLDVSNWHTSKVTSMSGMFDGCSKLTTLDVSNWDTGSVTNMSKMFSNCNGLTTLDVFGWNTSKVTNMSHMFDSCWHLTTLDVSSWNTSKVTDMSRMFNSCSSLEHIYIGSGWNTDKVTSSGSMFTGSTKLPNFNSSVVDKTNANADPDTGYMEMPDRFKVPYSIHFDKNAVDASGTMVDEAFAAGEKKALTANSYVRDGFAFLSWNTKADGTGRSFADGTEVSYLTAESSITLYAQWKNMNVAYSHTSNIDDNGTQNSSYGNNWSNANITGTDRGDTSKAHVITIPGAKTIKVTITFGGESANWDYACVWEGAHPDYTVVNNSSTSISGRLGGGSHTSASNTKTYTITGNTVTFGFKSDGSGSGDGYGYYAVVEKAS